MDRWSAQLAKQTTNVKPMTVFGIITIKETTTTSDRAMQEQNRCSPPRECWQFRRLERWCSVLHYKLLFWAKKSLQDARLEWVSRVHYANRDLRGQGGKWLVISGCVFRWWLDLNTATCVRNTQSVIEMRIELGKAGSSDLTYKCCTRATTANASIYRILQRKGCHAVQPDNTSFYTNKPGCQTTST